MIDCYFKPFVGQSYYHAQPKILLLGESHYDDGTYPDEDANKTICVVHRFLDNAQSYRFFRNALRCIYGAHAPKEAVQNVAFYNYVQEFVGDGPRERPTKQQWEQASAPFLATLEQLMPDVVICCGKTLYNHLPADLASPQSQSICDDGSYLWCHRYCYQIANKTIPVYGIRHPSSVGFSSQRYHEILRSEISAVMGAEVDDGF